MLAKKPLPTTNVGGNSNPPRFDRIKNTRFLVEGYYNFSVRAIFPLPSIMTKFAKSVRGLASRLSYLAKPIKIALRDCFNSLKQFNKLRHAFSSAR